MATSFAAAALAAEGLAKPTRLWIGNGYVPGHDEAALALLRRHPALARAFAALAGPAR
jgi:L-erythro-3,5-diaminohexanoate dehydrogenase